MCFPLFIPSSLLPHQPACIFNYNQPRAASYWRWCPVVCLAQIRAPSVSPIWRAPWRPSCKCTVRRGGTCGTSESSSTTLDSKPLFTVFLLACQGFRASGSTALCGDSSRSSLLVQTTHKFPTHPKKMRTMARIWLEWRGRIVAVDHT